MPRARILYSTIKRIIDYYHSGISVEELAQGYGVTRQRILYHYLKSPYAIEKYGKRVALKRGKLTQEQRNTIMYMYGLGNNRNDLAEQFGVSVPAIAYLVKQYREKRKRGVLMNEANRDALIKYSKPTKLCHAPYGTRWLHLSEETQEDLYIQTSRDMMQPDWRPISYVLEKAFIHKFSEEQFMQECLESYERNIQDSIQQ